ncbi:conserved hypothetical protein [Neospora caninum Liverpool]|uniref:Uncharacterized protein n=1 Tax=Neospora caninum (strain Liverpool) TaxID=572307 RepID=F0V8P7_NEOCL|nr:conserved hypothetical protein [Neospora caninum Liverpool]CBZ50088.1 conserved hypothetical protein [Neospora caninum Liverpool]CEL64683.1 TPA: hypothetical protein BN1204_005640 [Neospora caninum Liverpool]|eukprot:XP_003880123.1 conserved hypothetical protein [Neospora caninum Liverpool]
MLSESSVPALVGFPETGAHELGAAFSPAASASAPSLPSASSEPPPFRAAADPGASKPSDPVQGSSAAPSKELDRTRETFRRFRCPQEEDDLDCGTLCGARCEGHGYSPSQFFREPLSPRYDREMDDDDCRPPQRLNASEELRWCGFPEGRRGEDLESFVLDMAGGNGSSGSSPVLCPASSRASLASSLCTSSSPTPAHQSRLVEGSGDFVPAKGLSPKCGEAERQWSSGRRGRGRKRAPVEDEAGRKGDTSGQDQRDSDAGVAALTRLLAKKCRLNSNSPENHPDFLVYKPLAGTPPALVSPLHGPSVFAKGRPADEKPRGDRESSFPGRVRDGVCERVMASVQSQAGSAVPSGRGTAGGGLDGGQSVPSTTSERNARETCRPTWPRRPEGDTAEKSSEGERQAETKEEQMDQDVDFSEGPRPELAETFSGKANATFFSADSGSCGQLDGSWKPAASSAFYGRRNSSCSTSLSADVASPVQWTGSRPFRASCSTSFPLSCCSSSSSLDSKADDREHAPASPVRRQGWAEKGTDEGDSDARRADFGENRVPARQAGSQLRDLGESARSPRAPDGQRPVRRLGVGRACSREDGTRSTEEAREARGSRPGCAPLGEQGAGPDARRFDTHSWSMPTEKQKRLRMQELLAITRSPPSRNPAFPSPVSPRSRADQTRAERGVYRSVDLGALRSRTPTCQPAFSSRSPERLRADSVRGGPGRPGQMAWTVRAPVAAPHMGRDEDNHEETICLATPAVSPRQRREGANSEDESGDDLDAFLPSFSSGPRGYAASIYSFSSSSFSATSSFLSDSSSILSGDTFAPGLAPSVGSRSGEGFSSLASFASSDGSVGSSWLSGAGGGSPSWTGITVSTRASPPVSPSDLLPSSSLALSVGAARSPPATFSSYAVNPFQASPSSPPCSAPLACPANASPESRTNGAASSTAPLGGSSTRPSASVHAAASSQLPVSTSSLSPLLTCPDLCRDAGSRRQNLGSAPARSTRRAHSRRRSCDGAAVSDDSRTARRGEPSETRVIDYVAANRLLWEAQFE